MSSRRLCFTEIPVAPDLSQVPASKVTTAVTETVYREQLLTAYREQLRPAIECGRLTWWAQVGSNHGLSLVRRSFTVAGRRLVSPEVQQQPPPTKACHESPAGHRVTTPLSRALEVGRARRR
jgi:hypothetical protein